MAPSPKQIVKQSKNILQLANGCQIILKTPLPFMGSPSKPSSIDVEQSLRDFTVYKNRLRTFDNGWKLEYITPHQMADAGFFYLGVQDRVRCLFCSKEFDSWQRGDYPLVEHKKQSPQCAFFKTGYDVCGCYDLPTYPKSDAETKEIQQFLDSMGVVQQIKSLKNRDFATMEARLKTYDKCVIQLKIDIHALCEAGLYYMGDGQTDVVMCFFCTQGLKDWDDDDDPWKEHARFSPNCSFLLLNKGKQFVDEARDMKTDLPKINKDVLLKSISNQKDVTISENNNIEVNLTQRKIDLVDTINKQPELSLSKENLNLSQQPDTRTTPDSMLCKICYKEEMKVAFIPCGHIIACIQCAMTLDHCAVCRNPYNMAMSVYIHRDKDKQADQLLCNSSQCSDDEPQELMLCKVCLKEEVEVAFLPCRHAYACVKCAAELQECPVCAKEICATIQVYL
ncbi:Hypothetical protein CINCED_3A005156 [Cinara cedri]|nr:Hypothetical protein CINCED_3A005156 [Cinara cedri]